MRLIDADTLMDWIEINPLTDDGGVDINELIEHIDSMPTVRERVPLPSAQPEIIRCRDCKHYVLHVFFGRSQGWCERLCDEFDKSLARGSEDDDFCSRAERREE